MYKTAIYSLVFTFLVVIAGSVVRMTGSGMGCPDWPTCFGHLIPPTDASQIMWESNTLFSEGQMIIHNHQLLEANTDFTSGKTYTPTNWTEYTKHNYAEFNVRHTWTEYINRLIGALTGIPFLLLFILSFSYIKKNIKITLLAGAALFMLGFEAWLGKLVVDGNLDVSTITMHMAGVVLIILLLLQIMFKIQPEKQGVSIPKKVQILLWLALLFSCIQIFLGTQVREEIDLISDNTLRENWIALLGIGFKVHRSFSIAILLLNGYLFYNIIKVNKSYKPIKWLGFILVLEVISGIVMAYFSLPFLSQPIHLLMAFLTFTAQLWIIYDTKTISTPANSLSA